MKIADSLFSINRIEGKIAPLLLWTGNYGLKNPFSSDFPIVIIVKIIIEGRLIDFSWKITDWKEFKKNPDEWVLDLNFVSIKITDWRFSTVFEG